MRTPLPRRRRATAILAGLALASTLLGPALADTSPVATAAPFDYETNPGLSKPTIAAADIERIVVPFTSHDNLALYLEVVKPKAAGQYPVILEASPYHGTLADRDGTRILPDPKVAGKSIGLTGFFAPRGYAVAYFDLRGTGRSDGCLDHLGPNDAKDLKKVVEFLAVQPWSNGKVGMTGHSYVGSTPMLAAAQKPAGLTTIVPSAGLADMYDHQFQAGVPYNLQYAGPIFAYELLAFQREIPNIGTVPVTGGSTGDDFGNHPVGAVCGWQSTAAISGEGQLSGQRDGWHDARNSVAGATGAEIPVFLVHGVNDNAARIPAAKWFFDRKGKAGDKAWIGQWDHGSGCCPNRRGMQWPFALLGWFDKHLKGLDVATGPATEVFMNDAKTLGGAVGNTGNREVLQASGYPTVADSTLELKPSTTRALTDSTPAVGSLTFTGDGRGMQGQTTGNVTFTSAATTTDTVIAGLPALDLSLSTTSPRVHIIANVFDQSSDGTRRRITQFAMNPELRNGTQDIAPVIPTQKMLIKPPGFAMGHHLLPGHKLVLQISTSDPDKVATFATDPQITIFTGPGETVLRLPVVSNPTLVDDVL